MCIRKTLFQLNLHSMVGFLVECFVHFVELMDLFILTGNIEREIFDDNRILPWQVEVSVITGETRILSSDLVYDAGKSLNTAVDVGQVNALT